MDKKTIIALVNKGVVTKTGLIGNPEAEKLNAREFIAKHVTKTGISGMIEKLEEAKHIFAPAPAAVEEIPAPVEAPVPVVEEAPAPAPKKSKKSKKDDISVEPVA